MAEYNFNKMFQGDYSGLLNNNKYAQNIKNANALDLSIPKNTGLISNQPTANQNNNQSFAQPQYKERTFIDNYLRRENPDNAKMRNERNRAMIQDYMYNQIDNDEDRLLFSLDPKGWISKHTDSKFKDKNRSGYYQGRPYAKRNDTGLLHYLDGDQEQVFTDADSSVVGKQHSTIELYNEYNKVRKYKVDANGNATTELNPGYNPQLANYLLGQLENLATNENQIITISKNQFGETDVQIQSGGSNAKATGVVETATGKITMSGGNAEDGYYFTPVDIKSYMDDGKWNRELELQYQKDYNKSLKFSQIQDNVEEIGIDVLTTIPGAAQLYGTSLALKLTGEEYATKYIIGEENMETYRKAQEVIASQTGMLNAYIKEITGAQMSENEVKRLVQALANLGVDGDLGRVFGKMDNPVAFKTKFDLVMRHIQEARARHQFYVNNPHIMQTLEEEYPGIKGIDYQTDSRFIQMDIVQMTNNENVGGFYEDYVIGADGNEEKIQRRYGKNQEFYMNTDRIRSLMDTVKKYDIHKQRNNNAQARGMSVEEYESILNDGSHPRHEEIKKEDKTANFYAIQKMNQLFGLGKNEFTFEQRDHFKGLDVFENRTKDEGGYFTIEEII